MASSVSSSLALPAAASAALTCPLTGAPFYRPSILLEDGYTYEKAAIKAWLQREKTSPKVGAIRSATLLPNSAVDLQTDRCPITKEPFKEPYFCKEDCNTYEKEAIIAWFNNCNIERTPAGLDDQLILDRMTLYPNKILFKEGRESAESIFLDKSEAVFAQIATQPIRCVFDWKIRDLIFQYARNPSEELREAIYHRRIALGLSNAGYHWIDLSHLDLSKMFLIGLSQARMDIWETNFSESFISSSHFKACRIIRCDFTRTHFISCDFGDENTYFLKTDVQDAVFNEECILQKATLCERILDPEEFRSELALRGALHTETVSFRASTTGVRV